MLFEAHRAREREGGKEEGRDEGEGGEGGREERGEGRTEYEGGRKTSSIPSLRPV